jgi:hypothetical protein
MPPERHTRAKATARRDRALIFEFHPFEYCFVKRERKEKKQVNFQTTTMVKLSKIADLLLGGKRMHS